jgi:4-amino-4-deoxy-L-arabinose transferase-like glycosyltransferase
MHARAGWSLSLVIPAFNEEAGIGQAVMEADETLSQIAADYEILIIDDGSSDQTFDAASEAARDRPRVRVLQHETNRGYGAALRTGFEAARCDRIAFTDADCQFDLNDLAKMVPLANAAPIVAGYRIDRKDPWRRRFLSRGYNFLARTLLGTRVRDCDCALKVFRKAELSHLLPESRNFFVNTEMLTRAAQRACPVVEVGVTHRPRRHGESKVSMTDVPKTLATLIPFWWSKVLFVGQASGPPNSSNGRLPFLLVMAIAAILLFSRLGMPLLEPEEARYAEIPREMLADGQWLVPHLNGQPYLDKPPLLYWAVMASYSVFGVHDWAARLVPAFAALFTVAVCYGWASRTVGTRSALLGALVLCLSAKFIYMGRLLTMNAPLALATTATLALMHLAMTNDHPTRRRYLLFAAGIACGLGLLIKGPVALALVVPPVVLVSRLDPRFHRPGISGWSIFLITTLLVSVPWYVALAIVQPGAAGHFLWYHNVVRFVQPFDHQGPVWLYLPGFLLGTMPWALLAIPAVRWLFSRSGHAAERRPAALGVFLVAFIWMLAFFSLAGSKRPGYLVPVFPPLAMAIGCFVNATLPRETLAGVWASLARHRTRMAYGVASAALALGMIAGIGMLIVGTKRPEPALVLAAATALGWAFFAARTRDRKGNWLMACGATFAVLLAGVNVLLPEYARRFSLRHPVHMQVAATEGSTPVVCYPHRWDSVSFYTDRHDINAFTRENRDKLIRDLEGRPRTLVLVQTKYLAEVLDDLPQTLEFRPRQTDGGVTIGEVRQRREAGRFFARR